MLDAVKPFSWPWIVSAWCFSRQLASALCSLLSARCFWNMLVSFHDNLEDRFNSRTLISDLRKHPSLELALLLVFTYCPYVLAEGCHLSGIMAILFNGIVMSHYSHFNLSTVTQITMQQTMRTLAFICETCVFAYLGLAIFSFKHQVEPALVIWSVVLCLVGRAANIFPLSWMVNKFRATKITPKMSFIMWFSGLRGAISYALSLHLEYSKEETRRVVITTTLIIVLFTTVVFGGSTLPLLKFLQAGKKSRRSVAGRTRSRSGSRGRKKEKLISLSKTREFGQAIDSEHLSELTEEDEVNFADSKLGGFARWDRKFFTPFFTRRFTNQVRSLMCFNSRPFNGFISLPGTSWLQIADGRTSIKMVRSDSSWQPNGRRRWRTGDNITKNGAHELDHFNNF